MESALTVVQRHATERQAHHVNRIVLRIGALSGVEPDALRFAFDVVTRGTVAEGAVLVIEDVPARVYCSACQREFTVEDHSFIFTCPDCHALCGEVRSGRELELSRIEMS